MLLEKVCLYGIVDMGYVSEENLVAITRKLIDSQVIGILQLRAKGHSVPEISEWSRRISPLCVDAGIPLVVNDSLELALQIPETSLHLGQDDGSLEEAKSALAKAGGKRLIGRSTHSIDQAVQAQKDGADYIGFGPLYPTPTKPGRPAIGLEDLREVHDQVSLPIFCIGGVKLENLRELARAGVRRAVIVSGLLQAEDPIQYARECAKILQNEG